MSDSAVFDMLATLRERWCIAGLIMLLFIPCPAVGAVAYDATFALVPDRGTCTISDPIVGVRSGNFPPGIQIVMQFYWRNVPADMMFGGIFSRQTVKPDGTLDPSLALKGCSPAMPDGAMMTILVDEYLGVGNLGVPRTGRHFAQVTFTVDRSAPSVPGLPNTGTGGSQAYLSRLATYNVFTALLAVPLVLGLVRSRRRRGR
jgi:hypothetical protein